MNRAQSEIAAMQAVAAALSSLPDAESRARVLRWAGEHFDAELVPTVVTALQPAAAPIDEASQADPSDPENLGTLFDDGRSHGKTPGAAGEQPKSVVSSLQSFVADFQKLARDWKNA
jgi:hypothetical protein